MSKTDLLQRGELLPLINRYQAAWSEHATRIELRQNIFQRYLATAGLVFGFYFYSINPSTTINTHCNSMDYFLLFGVTFITFVCNLLFWMHNIVIEKLCGFMMQCEKHASDEIYCIGKDLFYFYDPENNKVHKYHGKQRIWQRIIFSGLLVITNVAAIAKSFSAVLVDSAIACIVILVVATLLPYFDLLRDPLRILWDRLKGCLK